MKCKKLIPEIQNYIDLVRSGTIEVCKEQLQLMDFVEEHFEEENLFVDETQLHKYLDLQKYFPFKLYEWEVFCFVLHNCTYKKIGILRFPDLFILVGRGAGKNGYLSFEDFCLISDVNTIKDYNISICANSEEQARTSFDDVYNVLEANEAKLKSHFKWNKEVIKNLRTGSELKFRTSNFKTKDGGREGKIDFDEVHGYENYKVINVFKTGLGKKANPRMTFITTNGDVRGGVLDDMLASALNILKGAEDDNGTLAFICRLDSEKEVDIPLMWDKANPTLHYNEELRIQIHKEYVDYKKDSINNSAFMTKRMNIPKGDKDVEVTDWENILATNQEFPPELEGVTCVAGIDYAKTTDFVCAGLLFLYKDKYYWKSHTWICSKCKDLGRIKAPLKEWEEKGLLTFLDEKYVEVSPSIPAEWLAEQGKLYNITTLGMDNYRYTLLAKALREVGFDTDKGGVNNIKLTRPSNQMLMSPVINSLFANHNIAWSNNPLMRWYTNNTCIKPEPHDNTSYGKIEPKSRKTDGFMAMVSAFCASENLEDSGLVVPIDLNLDCYTY
ncbi:terminase TerL endonuclease subunit [Clostridium tagluense]|nr:terminase TerL endonuclease subunit [Clostridium tagluense]MCB2311615.1 terminase large subunit [Clostridium tagluense]MCB2316339.1 terminase large subunit [Clostridium tagluense]MCB2326208.1 terminase large subunit [Clostridium tagluense]MCB2331013.1 terminase large subunit [Clostridium tagluense]WAG48618.1 terminase large subunit [Clostridium tagluense]